jgi:membrane protein YdbS with pleckstrin-like domain
MSQTESGNDPLTPATPHKPADDREEIYFEGSPLLRGEMGKFFLWTLIGALIIAAPIVYALTQAATVPWYVYLACAIVGVGLWVIPWIQVRSIRYRVSNYRIDYERGIFTRRIDTIELWHVDDISFKQGFIDRILGVGDISIMSDDKTTPQLTLDGVPNPRPLFDQLKQRIIAVKRQRGVIKMDTGGG